MWYWIWYYVVMKSRKKLESFISELEAGGVKFRRLVSICEAVFGSPRINGSHHIFKTPWPGEPRVNVQKVSGGAAKPYQVKQVLAALRRLSKPAEDEL